MCAVRAEDDPESQDEEDDLADDDFQSYYYYENDFDNDVHESSSDCKKDPEYFDYECLHVVDVNRLLNEAVESVCTSLSVTPSVAKILLYTHKWNTDHLTDQWRRKSSQLLVAARIRPPDAGDEADLSAAGPSSSSGSSSSRSTGFAADQQQRVHPDTCGICFEPFSESKGESLSCGHTFCESCWSVHLEIQVCQRTTITTECMAHACHILVPEEFALSLLKKPHVREKYLQFAFLEYVKSHPQLRFCPGVNCNAVFRARECLPRRVDCKFCKYCFCFRCGGEYHAPTDCVTIKKWLTKCADDSETAHYITTYTKPCPQCSSVFEKNGGCNHMQCCSCKYDFCWMCLGDWKSHGSEYYECSRYKENPAIALESAHSQAREALKKYLFYYERWENHSRSLRLEAQTLEKIRERIQEKVMGNEGTWIDWQYLLDAATLLAKCRYTLQYTYPYAYFMEAGPRKELFEYQQAQLEAEIENLSWKVERAETTDRGDLQNQMDVAEKRRSTLLKDFNPSASTLKSDPTYELK